jgi:hypothetical protein
MLMPLGKYKGCDLNKIPKDYLLWLIQNIQIADYLKPHILDAIAYQIIALEGDIEDHGIIREHTRTAKRSKSKQTKEKTQ